MSVTNRYRVRWMIATDAYTKPQITLHWLIVVLVGAQFLTAEAMQQFSRRPRMQASSQDFPPTP